jgi:hypothetical protein
MESEQRDEFEGYREDTCSAVSGHVPDEWREHLPTENELDKGRYFL